MNLKMMVLPGAEDLPKPHYAHVGDAGIDLYANEDRFFLPRERFLVSTGICVEIPNGYLGFITPKSGRAIKEGLSIINTPATIDSGYRGELKVPMWNACTNDIHVKRGEKLAQLIIMPVCSCDIEFVDELSDSSRGEGGFGSTGL